MVWGRLTQGNGGLLVENRKLFPCPVDCKKPGVTVFGNERKWSISVTPVKVLGNHLLSRHEYDGLRSQTKTNRCSEGYFARTVTKPSSAYQVAVDHPNQSVTAATSSRCLHPSATFSILQSRQPLTGQGYCHLTTGDLAAVNHRARLRVFGR